MTKQSKSGWYLSDARDFAAGTDPVVKHDENESVYLKSVVARPKSFGFLSKMIQAVDLKEGRLKLSAWVKTMLPEGASVQLWLRVDGDWNDRPRCFDNMYKRRLKGQTDWTRCEVTVNVPEDAEKVVYGVLLNGTGQLWLADVLLEQADQTEE